MHNKNIIAIAVALFVSASLPQHALADQNNGTGLSEYPGDFSDTLSDTDLAALRGGQDQFLNDMQLNAQLYSNTATSNVTGGNVVTQDAFAGTRGFATVIQNSGNNVIIQNATILNLRMQ